MVKTLDERHAEAEVHPSKSAPCETEADFRRAAQTGEPTALITLAQALIDNSIEHQDPDEALVCLSRAKKVAGERVANLSDQISDIEARAIQKQHELGEALQLELMHNEDA